MVRDQDGACAYCERSLADAYQVEHMVPLSRGGRNDWTNVAVTCAACNRSMGAFTVEEFFDLRQANPTNFV
jgi:5-methylcytosine-specific restriction endonuclease McrA